MKNKTVIIITFIVIVVLGFTMFLKMNPPLHSSGQSLNKELNPFTFVAEIDNKGFADIKLKEILVNSNENAYKVELGISRSNGLITISEVRDTSEGISFHEISDYPIKTPPESKYVGDFDTIRHYAIVVYYNEGVKDITVKYSYLGIPFEKKIAVTQSDG
ncbi:hypothetical protein [Alkalihalobacillus sp. AL-G]|uniref:hypothetical protein n=1 Tax=Alkalihalobacillus sp. AL-G TaxID=2926399 RepID=UPI00272A926A|nr:hypothetical protein [Alkalihalobacillus sp. AL-G]WLD94490.1 hypothetical protein MOJ78_06275 [Alkalihalobacillus sp. AL-G]